MCYTGRCPYERERGEQCSKPCCEPCYFDEPDEPIDEDIEQEIQFYDRYYNDVITGVRNKRVGIDY